MAAKTRRRRATGIDRESLADVIIKSLDYTTDGIIIGELGGKIYYHNKAYLDIHAFKESESFEGKEIREVERAELMPVVEEGLKALKKHGVYERQIGTVRKDGVYHDVLISAHLIPGSGPPVVVAILREVTDLVQAKKALERRNRELSIFNDIHHGIIVSAMSRRAVVRCMLKLLGGYIGADQMAMYEVDYNKAHAVMVDSIGIPRKFMQSVARIPMGEKAFGSIVQSPRTFVIEQDMPGYRGGPLDLRRRLGSKRTIGMVFHTKLRKDYLALFGLKRDEDISPEIRAFFEAVSNQFGIAIERVDLLDALESRGKELEDLTGRLISSGEEEKRQCSRMLHDEVGQALTGLKLEIDMFEKNLGAIRPCMRKSLEAMRAQIRYITDSTRTLSKSLHPAMLEDLGLVPTLSWYLDKFVRSGELDVRLEDSGFDEDLPLPVSLALYRVAQECLTNVLRHARASHVIIKLTKGYPHAIMTIEDDGKGISSKKTTSKVQGLGLISMRERVEHMGGAFQFRSVPGKGAKVRVTIPIEAKHVR